jgi:hypothetical protein
MGSGYNRRAELSDKSERITFHCLHVCLDVSMHWQRTQVNPDRDILHT